MRSFAALLVATLLSACGQSASPPSPSPAPTPAPAAPSGPDAVIQPVGEPVPVPSPSAPDAFGRGLDALCRITREVQTDATIVSADKPVRIVERFQASRPDPEVLRFLGSLPTMPQQMRYPALQAEATRHGLGSGWSCPELAAPNP